MERPAISRLAATALLLPPIGLAGLILWGTPRGLDLTDEGVYLLCIGDRRIGVTSFGAMVSQAFPFAAHDVVALRLVRLVLGVAGALALAWGALAWTRRDRAEGGPRLSFAVLAGAALCGMFLSYADLPQSLSYNSLNNVFLLMSAGGVLRFLARPPGDHPMRLAWELIAVGALVALQFFVKFSSAVLCSAAIGAVLLSHGRSLGRRGLAVAAASLSAGMLVGAAVFFAFVAAPSEWYAAFRDGVSMTGGTSHSRDYFVSRYAWDLRTAANRLPRQYFAPIVLTFASGLLFRLAQRRKSNAAGAASMGSLLVALVTFGVAAWTHAAVGKRRQFCDYASYPHAALLLMAGAGGVALLLSPPRTWQVPGRASWERAGVPAFLFVLPLCGTVGSNLHIFRHLLQHLAPWSVALALLAADLCRRGAPRWVAPAAVATASVVAGLQVVEGYALLPFRVPTPLASQTEPATSTTWLRGMRFDAASRDLFERTEELLAASGFRPGDPLLGLFSLNGIVVAVGGSAPGDGLFYAEFPERTALSLARIPRDVLLRSRLLVRASHRELAATLLTDLGVRFPDDYRLLGTVASPYEWGDVSVYAPR